MNWAELKQWNFHCKFRFNLLLFHYSVALDVKMKDILLDNGLSFKADKQSGAPKVNLFNTKIDLGSSSISLTGDFVAEIIGWFSNIFKTPLNILINEFFQPIANTVINTIIIPVAL